MTTAVEPVSAPPRRETPSAFQRAAIEAPVGPLLVRAGPGAGKTFCLIERIRFLIERTGAAPERLCAFTFTNRAAGEIASRLRRTLGDRAELVKSGTIHAFCAELLREFGGRVGLPQGFGIADENYQRTVLRRLGYSPRYLTSVLVRFGAHRFRGEPLDSRDEPYFAKYEDFLAKRRVVDFDMLLLKAAELMTDAELLARISGRWDCILIDEFQDLNPVQYAVIKALTRIHRHIVAVGDDEQSVYSWTGADPRVFLQFMNDFGISHPVDLHDNRRCPRQVVAAARRLVDINTPLLPGRPALEEGRESPYPVVAVSFSTEEAELAWIIDDIRRDREETRVPWGEIALLYRTHRIGDAAEAAFISAGIPCRLAQGRAFADDPIVAYVIAALRVIFSPDDVHHEGFLEVVLPRPLVDRARAQAPGGSRTFLEQLRWIADGLPREDGDGRRIRRGFSTLANLAALARRHQTLSTLVEELLSQRVGEYRTVLEDRHDELTDPIDHPEVVRLSERLDAAIRGRRAVWLPSMGGVEIPLRVFLLRLGVESVTTGGTEPPSRAEAVAPADALTLGLPVTLFKAAQLMRSHGFENAFRDFTAVDIETTDNDVAAAEIVDIAAVRVRDGLVVDELQALVCPRRSISPAAIGVHGLKAAHVVDAERFEQVWPRFQEFCARDVIVAHNGYHFDFPIIRRMASLSLGDLCTYDTLPLARELHAGSAKLGDLAHHFGVPAGTAHRALDDTRALVHVFLALGEVKVARARKTSLANLLDQLGLALAIADEDWRGVEVERLRNMARPYTLGRYSDCLETYAAAREAAGDPSLPSVDTVIERLGGVEVMQRIRAEKTADARYPLAMARLRRLLEQCVEGSLAEQIGLFLERVALSRSDGVESEPDRVNLLTLHSTKGLEFSRVYVVGAEDGQLPGSSATRQASAEEIEEARRLLYVGMTRTKDRLVLTWAEARGGELTGGHQFLDEMGLIPATPS